MIKKVNNLGIGVPEGYYVPPSEIITNSMKSFLGDRKIKSVREYYPFEPNLVKFLYEFKNNQLQKITEFMRTGKVKKVTNENPVKLKVVA